MAPKKKPPKPAKSTKSPKSSKPTKSPTSAKSSKPTKSPKPLGSAKSAKSPKSSRARQMKKAAKQKARSTERKERTRKANLMAKQHKQKLLDAKLSRQKQRNRAAIRMRRKMELQRAKRAKQQKQKEQKEQKEQKATEGGSSAESEDTGLSEDEALLIERYMGEDSCLRRFCMHLEDALAGLLYFLTVTLFSERTFDWLVFLANNLGLYQEYELNDYGQRLSPRTGRPVLLSLGPLRVVQVVESANQVRSHWDPYIREYLRNSKLTTDCWRANRMALQVALCMDDIGNMFDMPIHESAMRKRKKA